MSGKPSGRRILLSVQGFDPSQWQALLAGKRDVVLEPERPDDPSIEYAVVWKQPPGILARLPNLKAIFSIGAGVDHLLTDETLPELPIVRVVSDNLTRHMVEYAVWRVMDHHRQGRAYRTAQRDHQWRDEKQPLASDVTVGIMGLGELGQAVASALSPLGFRLTGWSRREKAIENVATFHGAAGLGSFLAATEILVVLLPLTPDTSGTIDHALLSKLRRDNALGGAVLINAGRGRLQKQDDILRALEDGTLKEASLDVFEEEPLPSTHPLWSHPRVFITPHAAAVSDPRHLAPVMLAQMDAFDRGEPLTNLVDRKAGY